MMKFKRKICVIFLLEWILIDLTRTVSAANNTNLLNSTTCVHQEKNEKQKFDKSPLVVTATFVKFDVYETDTGSMRVVQSAVFLAEKVHKGRFSFADTNGTVNLLLYKGLDKLSRRQLCLTEKLLFVNQSYLLFLNDGQTNPTVVWNATFVPEKMPNKKLQRIIFGTYWHVCRSDGVKNLGEVCSRKRDVRPSF